MTSTGSGIYTNIGSNGATAVTFPTDTFLDVNFTIVRTASGLDLSTSISNGDMELQSYSVSYNSPASYTFDTLGIGGTSDVGTFTIDNVTVSAVPEPSTYALLAQILGIGVIGMAGLRRRSGRAVL